jgi:hypothetical protein
MEVIKEKGREDRNIIWKRMNEIEGADKTGY